MTALPLPQDGAATRAPGAVAPSARASRLGTVLAVVLVIALGVGVLGLGILLTPTASGGRSAHAVPAACAGHECPPSAPASHLSTMPAPGVAMKIILEAAREPG